MDEATSKVCRRDPLARGGPPRRSRPRGALVHGLAALALTAASATGLAATTAGVAHAAADAEVVVPPTAPEPLATALMKPRLVPAPVAGGKGPLRPREAENVAPDELRDRLADEHLRARSPGGGKRLAFRTVVVCQKPGAPWRDRLARYLEEMFGGRSPVRVLDAADLAGFPEGATVAAFSDTGAEGLDCIDRDRDFRAFVEETPRPRRLFGRPVLCPSSVGVRGRHVRWYFADMNFDGTACETARFGEILGLPRWARNPARAGEALPAIRAHLGNLYRPAADSAGEPTAPHPRTSGTPHARD